MKRLLLSSFIIDYSLTINALIDQLSSEPRFKKVPEPQNRTFGSTFSLKEAANKSFGLELYHNGAVIATTNGIQTITGSSTVWAAALQRMVAKATQGCHPFVRNTKVLPVASGYYFLHLRTKQESKTVPVILQ